MLQRPYIAVFFLALGVGVGMSLAGLAPAKAEPLDKATCAKLKAEHAKMLTPEMEEALNQGPDWVKTHLDKPDIDKVRRYISVENKLDFRCPTGRYVKNYIIHPVPLPLRRPPPPEADREVVSTSQARAD